MGSFSLGDLPNPGINPGSPALQADSLPAEVPGEPHELCGVAPYTHTKKTILEASFKCYV